MPRYGNSRKFQQEIHSGKVFGHKTNLKTANLIRKMSDGQLRTRFPQIAHLSLVELRKEALKIELERRGQ